MTALGVGATPTHAGWRDLSADLPSDVCASAGTGLVAYGADLFIYTNCSSPFASRENLYKSTDGGNSWISLDTIVASDSIVPKDFDGVNTVTVDPNDPAHIVVTSTYTDCYPVSCMYVTDDGGAHWRKAPSPQDVSVKQITFDPYDSRTLYLTTGLELVMRSTDGGASWDTLDVAGQQIFFVNRPGTIYVSNVYPDQRVTGLYKSENSGDTWSDRVSLREMAFVRQIGSPAVAPDVLYARTTVAAENPQSGLWKSTDGAVTWKSISSGDDLDDLVVSPIDPDHLFVVVDQGQFIGDSIFESRDGGFSWQQIDTTVTGFPKGITNLFRRNSDLYVFSLSKLFVYDGAFSKEPSARASLENPSTSSFQSGIGLISGWVCSANRVTYRIDNGEEKDAAYGTSRNDTVPICGDANSGFGALINWNLLGNGNHTIRAYADGVEFGSATFSVTTLGVNFLRGASGQYQLANFPSSGKSVQLRWQEGSQNFVISGVGGGTGSQASVRYANDLVCNSTGFTSMLSANGYTWSAFSGAVSPYQLVNGRSSLGPFIESNNTPCGELSYSFTLPIASGHAYTLTQTFFNGGPFLGIDDDGALQVASAERAELPLVLSSLDGSGGISSLSIAEPQGVVSGSLENPEGVSFQSGIGVISGWVCSAGQITLTVDGGAPFPAAYGTSRTDTAAICGDANNGFGRLINWNLLGDGTHTVRAFADGMQFGEATFTVTTLGANFLTGASGQYVLSKFAGSDVTVRWQEGQQNFVIVGRE